MQLSWDLHLHPGPASEGRWGTGPELWRAASAAGVAGFVWKEHARRIEAEVSRLPDTGPRCLPSLVMNSWAGPEDVAESLAAGVRWFWGPTRDAEGKLCWDLSVPSWWPEAEDLLVASGLTVVLSTGHLDRRGRRRLAEAAARNDKVMCSVTHSLYVPEEELGELVELGCAFEHDLFTASFPIPGRPERELASALARALELGGLTYLTSDAGQAGIGNPFAFAAEALEVLAKAASVTVVSEVARTNPARVAAHLGQTAEAA
jgi:hypothetical protein